MDKVLTWIGKFDGSGAYPTVNRHMVAALERRGWRVLRNQHNDGLTLTPVAVTFHYPPRPVGTRHALNIAITNWEFPGPRGIPASWVPYLHEYDVVATPSAWVSAQFVSLLGRNVQVVPHGYDPDEFNTHVLPMALDVPANKIKLVWAGGTDRRHGLDVALAVMDQLPDTYHLIVKQSVHYPEHAIDRPGVTVIRDDLPSMAPFYRAGDIFLHTARGVGFALHCLEALACGVPVVSTDLSPVREYGTHNVAYSTAGQWQRFEHHVYQDCTPSWWEPDPVDLARVVRDGIVYNQRTMTPGWTWDDAVVALERVIDHARVTA